MSQTLYLKYRPQKISELDLVSAREMLEKVLKGKSLPHAWLFSGPRGTGKTSAARILAKEVNGNDKDLNLEIEVGTCTDVIEIDAASNRGIDEIRELRDKIKLAPMRAKYKVYIVDEVHMLTTEAANALLKTLEEPPAHAIFVLCTTDPEKLPETVISRCTRVQFKRPTIAEIVAKLKIVAKGEQESIRVEELEMIAKAARLLEFAEPRTLIELIKTNETKKALEFINNFVAEGVAPREFIERAVEELREQLLETMDKSLLPLIEGLERAYERTKTSAVPQLPLEIFVIENSKHETLNPKQEDPKPVKHGSGKGKFKLEDVQVRWADVLKTVRPHNHSVEALLRSTRPTDYDGDTLTLEVFYKFHKDKLETDKCRQIVGLAVGEVFGTDPARLILQLGQRLQPAKEEVVADSVDEDLVAAAAEIFKVEAV
ncbi:MAG: polymerase III, subunit gamma and tau protein [Microgenomates group bacterium GW2011_GWC1_46_20]|nr:MAG: polymerase III, subunit gamma and tau protein [Microgenomates group bacterium GW2011_GWC1_46_20]